MRRRCLWREVLKLAAWPFLPIVCLAFPGMLGPAFGMGPPQFEPGEQVGTVQHAQINEASGIAASRKNRDVLWVHNDSGDSARIFAMNTQGTHLGIYNIPGASAVDCEDIAIGPGPVEGSGPAGDYLYLGDIGDNNAARTEGICVYRVPEPTVHADQEPVDVSLQDAVPITLLYPDGARDAETLMVDPANGDIYIVSKREAKSRVYRAAFPQTSGMTMQFVTELPWAEATGGDISPLRTEIIIRGYGNASLWRVPRGGSIESAFGTAPCSVPLVEEPQGEAVSFDASGLGYVTVSEGLHQPIHYFSRIANVPKTELSRKSSRISATHVLLAIAVILALAIVLYGGRRFRRSPPSG